MTTGQRIIELRKSAGYTRTAFANKLGIPYTTLRNYENDEREPGHNFLIAVANELNVSIDYLLGISDDKGPANDKIDLSASEQAHITKYRQLNADGQSKVDEYTTDLVDSGKYAVEGHPMADVRYIDMPVYDEPAAAGIGNYLLDSTYETMSFPADIIPDGAEFGIRILGDSMEPVIKDGSIVWVKQQIEIENGEIGIFVLNNDAYCKRLHIDYDKEIVELISVNPKYRPIAIKASDSLRTVGKVLKKAR